MQKSEHQRLMEGEIVAVGNKLYRRCPVCHSIVRLNKPIFGEMHLCLTDEERQKLGR